MIDVSKATTKELLVLDDALELYLAAAEDDEVEAADGIQQAVITELRGR